VPTSPIVTLLFSTHLSSSSSAAISFYPMVRSCLQLPPSNKPAMQLAWQAIPLCGLLNQECMQEEGSRRRHYYPAGRAISFVRRTQLMRRIWTMKRVWQESLRRRRPGVFFDYKSRTLRWKRSRKKKMVCGSQSLISAASPHQMIHPPPCTMRQSCTHQWRYEVLSHV
jgi:hypothetical protein